MAGRKPPVQQVWKGEFEWLQQKGKLRNLLIMWGEKPNKRDLCLMGKNSGCSQHQGAAEKSIHRLRICSKEAWKWGQGRVLISKDDIDSTEKTGKSWYKHRSGERETECSMWNLELVKCGWQWPPCPVTPALHTDQTHRSIPDMFAQLWKASRSPQCHLPLKDFFWVQFKCSHGIFLPFFWFSGFAFPSGTWIR